MWILVIAVFWYRAPSIDHQEFTSQVACEKAKEVEMKTFYQDSWLNGSDVGVKAICVQK